MKFKNYHIPGLFDDFADVDELDLGESIGDMPHEEACKHRIPTRKEMFYLVSVGVLKQGDKSCWSSLVVSSNRFFAWAFYGGVGGVGYDGRDYARAVRCVGR